MRIQLERRLEVPRWLSWLSPVFAVAVALFLSGILLALVGLNPFRAYSKMLEAAFLQPYSLSDTTVKATPLILAGLGVALAFRMKQWNIGAEGQLIMGAWAATGVALRLLPPDTPSLVMIPAMMLAGFVAGALWGAIPGALKAYRGINEIITSLMLTYIAIAFANFFIYGPWSERGFGLTPQFPRAAWLPRLSDLAEVNPAFRGLTAHLGIVLGIAIAVCLWAVLRWGKWGYKLRVMGDNPNTARYAGMNVKRQILLIMVISGGLAGLAGVSEVAGVVHRLQERFSPGYGFTAIIVAWLARLNPLGVVLVAYLFGGLLVGGDVVQPAGIPLMIQGIVLFCVISGDLLVHYRIRIERRKPRAIAEVSGADR